MVVVIAVPTLILYGLIFPVLGVCYIGSKKDRNTNSKLVFRFGLMYSGYASNYWWWEVSLWL